MKKIILILATTLITFSINASVDSAAIAKSHTDSLIQTTGKNILPELEAITGTNQIGGIPYTTLLLLIASIGGLIAYVISYVKTAKRDKATAAHNAAMLAQSTQQTAHLAAINKTV